MESSGQYSNGMSPQRPLFQTPQLPPPSQLGLSSFSSRNNTLPPLTNIQAARYPPPTYSHPSLSNAASQLPPPLSTTTTLPWPSSSSSSQHRISSSRDEQITPPLRSSASRESMKLQREGPSRGRSRDSPPQSSSSLSQQEQQSHASMKHDGEDGMPSTSDFVKKLYKMLEDTSFADVVAWGPQGDCFVVKDMNEFTKSILPRMFKHSNFASFVRQLNKYDFHKVKNTDDTQFGEHSWTFRHPDFHADRRDALENIKRKVPAARKSTHRSGNSPTPPSTSNAEALQAQLDRMARQQDEMTAHIRNLETNYQNVLNEMVNFQRNMAQQDGLMQNLIQYFLQLENGKLKAQELVEQGQQGQPGSGAGPQPAQQAAVPSGAPGQPGGGYAPDANPFLPVTEAQRMMGGATYPEMDIARASLLQMNEISRRAEVAGMTFNTGAPAAANGGVSSPTPTNVPPGSMQQQQRTARPESSASRIMAAAQGLIAMPDRPLSRQDALARLEELTRTRSTSSHVQAQAQGQAQAAMQQGVHVQNTSGSPSSSVEQSPFDSGDFGVGMSGMSGGVDMGNGAGAAAGGMGGFIGQDGLERYGIGVNPTALAHEGLQVFTVGHLMPKSTLDDENGNWSCDPTQLNGLNNAVVMPTPQGMGGDPEQEGEGERKQPISVVDTEPGPSTGPGGTQSGGSGQTLRVRRSTYVPGWAVPPKVLLVDDDAVSRKLSSKFLQVFGCSIDVAVDGVGAVNKMNLEKYDLVLMDIVMPKLDGVSATSLIRQFDHMTPIISMTSNSKPSEIIKYYSSGMNDILPKPFTKDGLLDMLEKHLMHLKVIQTMSRLPRSVGIPPLSDSAFDQALQVSAANMAAANSAGAGFNFSLGDPDDGKINPLAGMGLSDEQYSMILQNLVNGESFMGIGMNALDTGSTMLDGSKRPLDDTADSRDGKRPRFEVIE